MPVLLSKNADVQLINEFSEVILVDKTASVYDTVSCHPDIYYCRLPGSDVFSAFPGEIGEKYPQNIGFNAVCLDKYFIHNLKYTNLRLLEYVKKLGLIPINVKQGYTKCSCVVVDGSSIITADEGIYAVLSAISDIDVLKISEGHVLLSGFDYGFLGGASGRVVDTLYFHGDITKHPDYSLISDFVLSRNIKMKWFDFPLTDIGSIIEFNSKI